MLPNAVPKPPKKVRVRKPLRSKKPMKKRNAKRGGHAFPKNVDEPYREWIRALPCILTGRPLYLGSFSHVCWGPVQVCHVKSRGTGGADRSNVVPMCAGAHDQQGLLGVRAFEKHWHLDLQSIARKLTQMYDAEKFPCP